MAKRKKKSLGAELVKAMGEVLAHARGEITLPSYVVHVPERVDVRALRARFKLSRSKFDARFGFDVRALQDWEQGRRQPDRSTRILLRVIEKEPEAVTR